jgi:hypothetical protein
VPHRSATRSRIRLCLLAATALAVVLALAPVAAAYRFGPDFAPTGPEQTVFDWSAQQCEPDGIPDLPVRAFRDASNRVHLLLQHWVNHQFVGTNLNSVALDCRVTLASKDNADPSMYDDRQWVASPYTIDGTTVYALLHNEYQGGQHPGQCSTPFPNCWMNSVTSAVSTDGGMTYAHAAPPGHLVATVPYTYTKDVPSYGYSSPSNIVKLPDGYYYALFRVEPYKAQPAGTCAMRTTNLADPKSWRAWNGSSFSTQFIDPYRSSLPAAEHICQPVGYDEIDKMTESLTFNTWLGAYLLIGSDRQYDPTLDRDVYGLYYSTSADLIHWTPRALLMEAETPSTYQCGDEDPIQYPSVLDPNSQSRNFETTGRTMNLYFTRDHFNQYCVQSLDRDLVKIPIEIPYQYPATPGFPRPKGATPIRVPLVVAYKGCTAPNRTHQGPLSVGSCYPPSQISKYLTVGTLDANGKTANATGWIRYQVVAGNPSTSADEADVKLSASSTDVRRTSDLSDYTGELSAWVNLRLTDRNNGDAPWRNAATVTDLGYKFAVPCTATTDTTRGATCSVNTTADSLVPGTVVENRRAIWQLGKIQLLDGGADGLARTAADNAVFEIQGVFVP